MLQLLQPDSLGKRHIIRRPALPALRGIESSDFIRWLLTTQGRHDSTNAPGLGSGTKRQACQALTKEEGRLETVMGDKAWWSCPLGSGVVVPN